MVRVLVLAGFCALAACGGGGGGGGAGSGGGIDPRLARLDIYEAQKLRVLGDPGAGVMGMAPTPDPSIPDIGTAVFEGSASVRIETANAPLVLFGDATVSIGFDDASVGGSMDRFFGTDATGRVVDYSGAIAIDGGSLDDGVTLDYAGVLSGTGATLVFDGTMTGQFLGDPLTALSAADLEASVIVSGTPTDATMVVIGETTDLSQDPLP